MWSSFEMLRVQEMGIGGLILRICVSAREHCEMRAGKEAFEFRLSRMFAHKGEYDRAVDLHCLQVAAILQSQSVWPRLAPTSLADM